MIVQIMVFAFTLRFRRLLFIFLLRWLLLLSSWFMFLLYRQPMGVVHRSSRRLVELQGRQSRSESGQMSLRRSYSSVFQQTLAVSGERLASRFLSRVGADGWSVYRHTLALFWCHLRYRWASRVGAEGGVSFDRMCSHQGPSLFLRWQRLSHRGLHSRFCPIEAPAYFWHLTQTT